MSSGTYNPIIQARRIDITGTDSPAHYLQGMDADLIQAVEDGNITLRRAKTQQQERNRKNKETRA